MEVNLLSFSTSATTRASFFKFKISSNKKPSRCSGCLSIDENLSVYQLSKRYADYYYGIRSGIYNSSYYDSLIFEYIRLETDQINFDSIVGKVYRFFSSVNRTLRFWCLDRYILPEDLKRSLFKLFTVSFDYWSRKELRFLNDFYDYLSVHPESDSFLKSRTVGYCLPSKDDKSFWNELNSTLSFLKKSVSNRIFQEIKHKNYNDISGLLSNLNF